jgi:transposase-like protein
MLQKKLDKRACCRITEISCYARVANVVIEEAGMARKRHTAEQVIAKLREAEIELAKGQSVALVVKKLGVTEQTYYRWRKEYGGLRVDQAKRLRELERENSRLKKVVADQALDNAILREAASGNF